jgi:hypothetical protein
MGSENLIVTRANWRYHVSRLPLQRAEFPCDDLRRACLASGHHCKRDISRQHSPLNLGGVPVEWRNQAMSQAYAICSPVLESQLRVGSRFGDISTANVLA